MEKKRTANTEIKQKNRTNIYQLLRKRGELSRQDIVSALQLSLPTVTQNLIEMQNEGLIEESGSIGNTGGRRAKVFSIVKDARTAIGIDVTKNHVTAVAVDLNGEIRVKMRTKLRFERTAEYYRELGSIIEKTIAEGKMDRDRILGVGIGVPGLITPDNQTVFYGEILNFTGATCQEFSQYIPFPSALFNDANAAGFAETWTNPDIKNAFYIMLSNNVGGAIYINNSQYCGENIRAGEVGHIIIEPDGLRCYCGQRGCVDRYCAATVLSNLTDGNLGAFFEKLKGGDAEAKQLWDEYLRHLATTVINIRMLFDCPIIIGGYVGEYIDDYLDDLKALVAGRSSFEQTADYIIPCRYKNEAIAAGAALNYIYGFLNQI